MEMWKKHEKFKILAILGIAVALMSSTLVSATFGSYDTVRFPVGIGPSKIIYTPDASAPDESTSPQETSMAVNVGMTDTQAPYYAGGEGPSKIIFVNGNGTQATTPMDSQRAQEHTSSTTRRAR
jgi:hypothetical protein